MNNELFTILQTFHDATDLNIYVFSSDNKFIRNFTSPLAPQLSAKTIKKLNKKEELNLLLVDDQSSIGNFSYKNFVIVGWDSNFTMASGSNYDRLAPLLGFNKFVQNLKCLFFMVYNRWPKIDKRAQKITIGENIITKHSNQASYQGYRAEVDLMSAVATGNIYIFNKRFRDFVKYGNFGSFKQSKLRNEKDMAIAATTLYTRAAISGGVPIAEAYQLSDKIIIQIEKDRIISNYYEYSRAIGEIFVNRVSRFKRKNVNSIVFKAQEYIYNNFSTIKSVEEVARHVNISLSYLQHIFKAETHVSIVSFINENKIQLAKQELIFSNKSIEEIAHSVGFSSLSVFSNTFKKMEGISPQKYRKQHI